MEKKVRRRGSGRSEKGEVREGESYLAAVRLGVDHLHNRRDFPHATPDGAVWLTSPELIQD